MSLDRLIENIIEKQNPTVAGLDPKLSYIPTYIKDKGVESYTIKDKETGLAFRVTKDYTFDKDAERMRVDAVYGWALTRPEFAVKVMSIKGLLEE